MGIKDPDVIACAMLSVNIISDETVMDIASVATMQEKDAQLVRSQVWYSGINHRLFKDCMRGCPSGMETTITLHTDNQPGLPAHHFWSSASS